MILNFNKPKGISSQQAVTKVKKLLSEKKAGHTGTLDPLATGVLVICLGKSTKLASRFSGLDKEYVVTIKLGERRDTFDAEGKVINKRTNFQISKEKLKEILKKFKGRQFQKVPPFSAVKKSGTPLYKLARKGKTFKRPEREIFIYKIKIEKFDGLFLKLKVKCSKGTYIRSLVDDIGSLLGTFAYVFELQRAAVGNFKIKNSFTLEDIKKEKYKLLSPSEVLK